MSHDPTITDEEILIATGRFNIDHTDYGSDMQLATDFNEAGRSMSTIDDCVSYADTALQRGYKVFIGVPHDQLKNRPIPPGTGG